MLSPQGMGWRRPGLKAAPKGIIELFITLFKYLLSDGGNLLMRLKQMVFGVSNLS
jgi:hypothetical protein